MAERIEFEGNRQGRSPLCLACEEMLADAVDETLSPADQAFFDRHVAGCVDCSQMVAEARRGAAWLTLLKAPRPEPSAALMDRILAQTSGLEGEDAGADWDAWREFAPVVVGQPALLPMALPAALPVAGRVDLRTNLPQPNLPGTNLPGRNLPGRNLVAFPGRLAAANPYFQPRLAMTAAMAFFSIALTLNLTGVRLDRLNARSLNPANLKRTYYEANADAVRYYDNLRVVRLMESRVDDLRDENADRSESVPAALPDAPPVLENKRVQPGPAPEKAKPTTSRTSRTSRPSEEPGGGISRRELPLGRPKGADAGDGNLVWLARAKDGKGGLA